MQIAKMPRSMAISSPSQRISSSSQSFLAGRGLKSSAMPRRASSCTIQAQLRNFDQPEALLFDCDGVLVDTERDGHRISFNEAFRRKGLVGHEWNMELYGELLEIGGGKERMYKYFTECDSMEPFKSIRDNAARKAFLQELHVLKTQIFSELIETGALPLRPGVKRLIHEAMEAKIPVAVCSTSNEKAVSKIVEVMLGPECFRYMKIFAGDVVKSKKPSPDIYLLAASTLKVNPARCVVIEDSRIGLLAGKAAGMRVIVTRSGYTQNENFDIADHVVDCIGEKGEERFSLNDLTTPGTFWLQPPLPMDANGNMYNKGVQGSGDGDLSRTLNDINVPMKKRW